MTFTLFDALLDLAEVLPASVYQGTVTTGAVGSVTDTNQEQPTGFFAGGMLLIESYVVTGPVTIARTAQRITDHTGTVLTFTPVHANAITAATVYYAAKGNWSLQHLLQAINAALRDTKVLAIREITADGDQVYTTTDSAVIANEIMFIEVAQATAEPYNWQPHYNWEQKPEYDSTGFQKADLMLEFDPAYLPPDGYLFRIHYLDHHPSVSAGADIISAEINRETLKWQAAVHALRRMAQEVKTDDPTVSQFLNEAVSKVNEMRLRAPVFHQRVRHSRW